MTTTDDPTVYLPYLRQWGYVWEPGDYVMCGGDEPHCCFGDNNNIVYIVGVDIEDDLLTYLTTSDPSYVSNYPDLEDDFTLDWHTAACLREVLPPIRLVCTLEALTVMPEFQPNKPIILQCEGCKDTFTQFGLAAKHVGCPVASVYHRIAGEDGAAYRRL